MRHFNFQTTRGSYGVTVDINKPTPVNPASPNDDNAQNTTVIFLNALGVHVRKYDKLISGLTKKGITVISADYPCCGRNVPHIRRGIDYDYNDLLTDFIPNMLKIANEAAPNNEIVLAGHSLGGHLGTLYSATHNVPVIGIATGNLHYRNWQGLGVLNVFKAVAVVQLLTRFYGYFPGYKIGFGDKEPKTLMRQWSRIGQTGKFKFIEADLNKGKGRGLYLNIRGDNYSPLKSTKKLATLCADSKVIEVKLDANLKGNPHGVWIKKPDVVIKSICDNLNYLIPDKKE